MNHSTFRKFFSASSTVALGGSPNNVAATFLSIHDNWATCKIMIKTFLRHVSTAAQTNQTQALKRAFVFFAYYWPPQGRFRNSVKGAIHKNIDEDLQKLPKLPTECEEITVYNVIYSADISVLITTQSALLAAQLTERTSQWQLQWAPVSC